MANQLSGPRMAEGRCPKEFERELKTLINQRTRKKGNITTRIKTLEELMDAGGSRRAMATVMQGLLKVWDELQQVCDEISDMTDEINELNNLDTIRVRVEVCVATTTEHLDGRAHEPASTETSSWVAKHADISRAVSENDYERENGVYENVESGSGYVNRDVWTDRAGISHDNISDLPPFSGGTGARQQNSGIFANQNLASNQVSRREDFAVDFDGRPLYTHNKPGLSSYGVYDESNMSDLRTNVDSNSQHDNTWRSEHPYGNHQEKPGMKVTDPHEITSSPRSEASEYRSICSGFSPGDSYRPMTEISSSKIVYDNSLRHVPDSRNVPSMHLQNDISHNLRRAPLRNNFPLQVFSGVPPPSSSDPRRTNSEVGMPVTGRRNLSERGCASDIVSGAQVSGKLCVSGIPSGDQSQAHRRTREIAGVAGARSQPVDVNGARPVQFLESQHGAHGSATMGASGSVPVLASLTSVAVDRETRCRSDVVLPDQSNQNHVHGTVPDAGPHSHHPDPARQLPHQIVPARSTAEMVRDGNVQSSSGARSDVVSRSRGAGQIPGNGNVMQVPDVSGGVQSAPNMGFGAGDAVRRSQTRSQVLPSAIPVPDVAGLVQPMQNLAPGNVMLAPDSAGCVQSAPNIGYVADDAVSRTRARSQVSSTASSIPDVAGLVQPMQNLAPGGVYNSGGSGQIPSPVPISGGHNAALQNTGVVGSNYHSGATPSVHSAQNGLNANTVVPGTVYGGHQFDRSPTIVNTVDSWIDQLDPSGSNIRSNNWMQGGGVSTGAMMSWMVQQHLPQVELPTFGGSPGDWVNFITKFRDVVHAQEYLNDSQRMRFLLQQLKGEAEKAVKGFQNDSRGYVLALKQLKKLFGQRSLVARAVLAKVTKGKPIENDDVKGLSEFLYSINDCLITLKQLNYVADLHSSDTLQQALQRLPVRLLSKWSDRCLFIRRTEEPNLVHLEAWLQDRVLALKEMNLSSRKQQTRKPKEEVKEEKFAGATMKTGDVKYPPCPLCKKDGHSLGKCFKYKELSPGKRMEAVKELNLCYNCLTDGHSRKDCKSTYKCFESRCEKRHHTTLHGSYKEKDKVRQDVEKKKDKTGAKDGKNNGDAKVAAKEEEVEDKLAGLTTVAKKEVIL